MKTFIILASLILSSTIAFSNAEAQTKVSKKVVKKQKLKTIKLAKDSYFGFVGAKLTGDHSGHFTKFDGTISVRGRKVEALKIDVKTSSLVSTKGEMPQGIATKLEGHLKSPDFLNVKKFPNASFESTSIERETNSNFTHVVTGNLEILGIKKSITFPATIRIDKKSTTANAEFKIARSVFGIIYNGRADDLIKDDVLLKIKFSAK